VYLLFGFINDRPAAYVGVSTTSMLSRIRDHHVTPRKDWFGTLFAVPIQQVMLCQPLEAELIRRVSEAGVVDFVDNRNQPRVFLDVEDDKVTAALTTITEAFEMLLGTDIFTAHEDEEAPMDINVEVKPPTLARVYQSAAKHARKRQGNDPSEATHSWVGSGLTAWGAFEGPEPDTAFKVFAGSQYRPAVVNYSHTVAPGQERVERSQQNLVESGVLDVENQVFQVDHIFPSWTRAAYAVSGKSTYSGGYHWQQIE
jgi:hypothetical protein